MKRNSTIHPKLTPLKAFYEPLDQEEQESMSNLSRKELEEEIQLLETIPKLPKVKRSPSASSIDIILEYSKKQSRKDFVY